MFNNLPLWPVTQNFKFNKYNKKANKSKVEFIENFFLKKYNSKYCVLVPSARVGIILTLKYKKFDRSKIFKIPKWSSHCLNNSIGYVTNITCTNNYVDGGLLVHHLGQSFRVKKNNFFIIDDSSDSLPHNNFKACFNSNLSEVISLPKIIGSFVGGIVLTNHKNFYFYLKNIQSKNIELATIQTQKKYNCLILKKKIFDWHYTELNNYSIDYNLCENVYENLNNFNKNLSIIKKRRELFSMHSIKNDKYRLGPCLIMKYNSLFQKNLESYHVNIKRTLESHNYIKRHILPIHFTITDKELEKKIYALSRN